MMKKLKILTITLIMALMLVGCGSTPSEDASQTEDNTSTTTQSQTDSRILIAYFTPANSDTLDALSQATPRTGDVASVEYVAQLISKHVEANTAKIVPDKAYPPGYNDTANQAKSENDKDERPAFTIEVNPEDYDILFVGYPIWWYEMPMIMDTFFEAYDFSGKTIIPFNTHAGSQDGGTYSDIATLEPDAKVLDGLAIEGDEAGDAEEAVTSWLEKLGY